MLIYSSPQLIAVNRVLHRLLMPRHSPYALFRLNFLCCSFSIWIVWVSLWTWFLFTLREKAIVPFWMFFHLAISRVGEIVVITLNIGKTLNFDWSRYLMSSISVRFNSFSFLYSIFNDHKLSPLLRRLVGLDGFEPSTSRLSGARSNHLSYRPFSLVS